MTDRVEWPLGWGQPPVPEGNEHAPSASAALPEQPLLPIALDEHVAQILASPAIEAIARKRAVQIVTHGHTPEHDLTKPLGLLACEAKARLDAFTEIVGGRFGRMNLPPARREQCLRYVEISAGILLALWGRCQVEVPEE